MSKNTKSILPENFVLETYEDIRPFLDALLSKKNDSVDTLRDWIVEFSEIDAFLSEDMAWRYINYTCHTANEEITQRYLFFVQNIQPELVKRSNEFNSLLVNSPFFNDLPDAELLNLKRLAKLEIDIFREDNIELEAKLSTLSQQYAGIIGDMTIEHNGTEYTLQQASKFLFESDRELRRVIFEKIQDQRLTKSDALNQIFNEMIVMRTQIAKNAGFDNFRDYKHFQLGRFDYTVEDVLQFHQAIREVTIPLVDEMLKVRREKLHVDELFQYDLQVNIHGTTPLKPFETGTQLAEKAIASFKRLDPFFGEVMTTMRDEKLMDLDSRKGKAPGGYNYPLDKRGWPFIFMNASGTMRDVTTMVHEGGHALHTVLSNKVEVNSLKHCPSEFSELASMSMELFSMDTWDEFYDNPADLFRAKLDHLEGVIDVLPWIATVDAFQHWVYTNPNHTVIEREENWWRIFNLFNSSEVNFAKYEKSVRNLWQKQLHIFEVPFYYIEYAIAQLGAIAMWKNYCQNPAKTLESYKKALSLGYTLPITELYKIAGIEFNFSKDYVKELLDFVAVKWNEYKNEFDQLTAVK